MEIREIVTVSDARAQLSRILATLDRDGSDAEPVVIGAHRKAQGVLLSVAMYEELTSSAQRRAAAQSVAGSQAAEGLQISAAASADTEAYTRGDIDADELLARAVARHRRGPLD